MEQVEPGTSLNTTTNMINSDLTKVSAIELIEHLQEIETCDVELNPHGHNPFGFDLYFVPTKCYSSHISNIEVIAKWAEVHRHTLRVGYDSEKEAINVRVSRLYPDDDYTEDEIIS